MSDAAGARIAMPEAAEQIVAMQSKLDETNRGVVALAAPASTRIAASR